MSTVNLVEPASQESKHAPTQEGFPRPAVGWYITFCLFAATVLSYIDRGVISLVIPELKAEFGLSDTGVSLIQGLAFSGFLALTAIPAGHLVDKFNRRNIIIAGICVWSAMTACCGLATNVAELFGARAGVGIGEALLIPASYSILAACFRPERRGRAMGILIAGASLGGALSSFLGGAILKVFAGQTSTVLPLVGPIEVWRVVFLSFGVMGMAIALLMLTFREPVRQGVSAAPRPPGSSAPRFFKYARDHLRLFASLYLAISFNVLIATSMSAWVMVALIRRFGISAGDAGMVIGVVKLGAHVFGAFLGGVVGDLWVERRLPYGRLGIWLIAMPVVMISGSILFLSMTSSLFIAGFVLLGVSTAFMTSVAYAMIYDVVPAEFRGQSVGYCAFMTNIIGTGLGTTILALVTDYVFRDEYQINRSMGTLAVTFGLLAFLLVLSLRAPYERLRQQRMAIDGRTK
jgi:MFS family permease